MGRRQLKPTRKSAGSTHFNRRNLSVVDRRGESETRVRCSCPMLICDSDLLTLGDVCSVFVFNYIMIKTEGNKTVITKEECAPREIEVGTVRETCPASPFADSRGHNCRYSPPPMRAPSCSPRISTGPWWGTRNRARRSSESGTVSLRSQCYSSDRCSAFLARLRTRSLRLRGSIIQPPRRPLCARCCAQTSTGRKDASSSTTLAARSIRYASCASACRALASSL